MYGKRRGISVLVGETHISTAVPRWHMVVQTERDDVTWFKCEGCGMLFDDQDDASQHEANCDAEEPSYIQ
jgi:hypothetical protein